MLEVVAKLVTVSDPQKDLFQGGNRDTVAFDAKLVQPLIELNEEFFEARGVFNWDLECDLGGYIRQLFDIRSKLALKMINNFLAVDPGRFLC